ncbi:MAG: hypothetical protein M3454_02950 [Actinomycetota bacterium]|nr:hypothetical protein [Actinomycetota bacterium]
MCTSIEATILESRFEHFSEYLFDGATVHLGLEVDEGAYTLRLQAEPELVCDCALARSSLMSVYVHQVD